MITLGIETSCDETAAAILEDGKVLSSEVSSSVHLHSRYGGVIPEIASRFHTEFICPVFEKALHDAGKRVEDIDRIAVTEGPGLPGSLLVGLAFAKALSFARTLPILGVNHLHGHMAASTIRDGVKLPLSGIMPFIGVVVSGGHTSIFECRELGKFREIGRTRDDAAGEAFDKVSKILDLGYPGGPLVEEKARGYDGDDPIPFARPLLKDEESLDFSFSGIKTAALYYWRDSSRSEEEKEKVCFSFQNAIIDTLVEKVYRATRLTGIKRVAVGGGVVNNTLFRQRMTERREKEDVELYLPEKRYCSDNAVMIAAYAEELFDAGVRSDLTLNAKPLG
ncbi:MAG: tRNA (adenosine(37)-N6)-threonylcarbamoyltransferase complex transferase subunit TsaD [Candidatus Omnitrophica bacterium]|nr:tRNA (adenosine(37)-N6)-threonylcarbamoyltransferase complex transferase subunit TsaD [Candidatus Omnitrophota bacterium]MDD5488408.1 tRNA (adenosine(37)-N6)-threonylcarbamoyltransferase complex transferase subunit TsaD [Candidatus Omnitrophota bacterium]